MVVLLIGILAVAPPVWAHGFGDRYDLPVPLSIWVAGAAVAVGLSFVIIGLFVRSPAVAGGYPRINLLRWRVARILVDPRLWRLARITSVALLALFIAAGVLGNQNPTRNVVPTAVWVIWWVGFAYLSALLGNVWMIVNPWSGLFEAVGRFVDGRIEWGAPYPPCALAHSGRSASEATIDATASHTEQRGITLLFVRDRFDDRSRDH